MSFTRDDPALETPVQSIETLVEYFRAGEKSPDALLVGTEHEKIGLREGEWTPLPYEGERGIGVMLQRLSDLGGFTPLVEDGVLLGLERAQSSITLEPGGQLELSGAPLGTLFDTCREFHEHLELMREVSAELGVVWLGLGTHPLADTADIPRMPRERHALMRTALARSGRHGLDMMHATAGVQANFDYTDELDAGLKLRVALAASPVVSALFANSPIARGAPNGFESWRTQIWRDTDPDRCGLLPFVFDERCEAQGLYRAYTEWALEVPLFFLVRGGHHGPPPARSFREWLERPAITPRPTLADWNVHLTTLFPEVRLKHVIEVRGADAVPPGLVCALPALWKGLLYDPASLHGAYKRFAHWSHADADALHAAAARNGLGALGPDGPVLEVARELLALSSEGLARIAARSGSRDERPLLEPLEERLERGRSPAREILDRWAEPGGASLSALIEHTRY